MKQNTVDQVAENSLTTSGVAKKEYENSGEFLKFKKKQKKESEPK